MNEHEDDKTRTHAVLTGGTMVSHYRIVEKIGAGGMGEVYLAEDTELDRKVALKFLPARMCQDEDCRKRFKREAQAAAKLKHPNIVTIYEVSDYRGRPFFAMEHIEGESLREMIKAEDLQVNRTIDLAIQILEGLDKAHKSGVTHRDIKPSNIVIDADGRPKLLDFGLATVQGMDGLTKTGSTLGTVGYMSPEQIQVHDVDQRSDLFSFGVVLYGMITGRLPFAGDNEAAIMNSVLHGSPAPLARDRSDVPDDLQRIVSKLLEKDPKFRYQSAAGVVSDIRRVQRDSESGVTSYPVEKRPSRVGKILVPVLIVVIAALIMILKPWKIEVESGHEAVAAENRLAIMYFDNLADPSDSLRLGEIVTNLLITDLSESEYVNVVSSQRLFDILKQLGHEGEKKIDHTVATQVATKAGAKWILLGSILNTEPDIVVTAHLVEIASGDAFASQRIEGQPGQRIFSVVDQLTSAIKQDLSLPTEASQEPDPFVAEMTTESPEAYRLYLEAQELFYRHQWTEAEVIFLEALRIDSTFAMAHFHLALVGYWSNDPQARTHIANALKYADAASHKGTLYINSLDARIRRDIPRSIEILKKIMEEDPEDKNTYVTIGLLLKYEMQQLENAVEYFEKAVELDPYHREALNQLAYCNNSLGHFEKAMSAANKYVEIAPDEPNAHDSRGEILAMNGKLDEAIASYEQANMLEPGFGRSSLANLYLFREEYVRADSLFRAMVSDANERTRAAGRLALTRIPRYQGRFQDALRVLEIGIETDRMELGECPQIATKLWTRVLINDLIGNRQAVIEDLKEAIVIAERSEARNLFTNLYRAYLAAELRSRVNQHGADSVMVDIEATITVAGHTDSSGYWIASALTHFKLEQYDAAALLWERILKPEPHHFPSLMYLGMSYLGSGQLGSAVSVLEKASNIYDGSRGGTPDMGVLCHYQLGKAYEASGWTDKAIEQYEIFLDIWKDADDGLESVEDAEQRLAGLKAAS